MKGISKDTALPPITIASAFAAGAMISWGTLFWAESQRTRTRQDNYIARDAVEFAKAEEEHDAVKAELLRICVRHAVEDNNKDFEC